MANEIEIARLVGHVFGDGSIHKSKQYFIYTNSNEKLQQVVQQIIEQVFGKIKFNIGTSISETPRYQYSNIVGKFLANKGAPVGSKIFQPTKIPEWISEGSEEIKSAFLGAIFDDEGNFRDSKNSRQIVFKSAKVKGLKKELEQYLSQIIQMLNDLGIKTSGIKRDQIKKRKDGSEIVSLRFWITGRENFKKFQEKIMLLHPEKIRKLSNMVPAG
jgi:intein/homing endonuclease